MLLLPLLACIQTGLSPAPGDAPEPPEEEQPVDTGDSVADPLSCPPFSAPIESPAPQPCERPPREDFGAPARQWQATSFRTEPNSSMVMMAPVAADGRVWVVTFEGTTWYRDGVLRGFDGATGEALVTTVDAGLQGASGLALGDLDGDGALEVVGISTTGELLAFSWDGALLWRSEAFASFIGYSANPAIADLDGDGRPEVIAGPAVLSAEGLTLGVGAIGRGSPGSYGATSVPYDLDGDGLVEVLVGRGAFNAAGETLWELEVDDGFVAPGDVDGDGAPEVVVSGLGELRVQDPAGVRWTAALPGAERTHGGPPALVDLDGDGALEILVSAGAALSAFDGEGALLWSSPIQDPSTGISGVVAFDLNADGHPELLLADEVAVRAFSAAGEPLWAVEEHGNWTTVEYATVADVDGDGVAELLVGRSEDPGDDSRRYRGLLALSHPDWPAGPSSWPQHAHAAGDGSFRAAPTGPSLGVDLRLSVAETCTLECPERAWLRLVVANHGTLASSATTLSAGGEARSVPSLEPGGVWVTELETALPSLALSLAPDPLACDAPEGMELPGCG